MIEDRKFVPCLRNGDGSKRKTLFQASGVLLFIIVEFPFGQ